MNTSNDRPNKPFDASGATPLSVTLATARQISGLGYTTLWKLIGNGTLATVRVGRRRLIAYDALRQLLTPEIPNSAAPANRRKTA
jgi:excisionase family DNA binding protein